MIQAKCIEKFRNKNNQIVGYLIEDCNGQQLRVAPDQLKMAIFSQQIKITNLKFTKDGRLIDVDNTENTVDNKLIQQKTQNTMSEPVNQLYNFLNHKYIEGIDYKNVEEVEKTLDKTTTEFMKLISNIFPSLEVKRLDYLDTSKDVSLVSVGNQILYLTYVEGEDEDGVLYTVLYNALGRLPNMEKLLKSLEIIKNRNSNQSISAYTLGLDILEITSKFTDTKYATVGRYINMFTATDSGGYSFEGLWEDEQCINLFYNIIYNKLIKPKNYMQRIKLRSNINKYSNDYKLSQSLLRVDLYSNNEITITYPTYFYVAESNEYNKYNLRCKTEEREIKVDPTDKNYKKKLKLQLEQYFKIAYHNLKLFLDEIDYK